MVVIWKTYTIFTYSTIWNTAYNHSIPCHDKMKINEGVMNKINCIPAGFRIGSAIIVSFFLFSGCSGIRYDETEKRYSSPQSGVRSTVSQHGAVTEHYNVAQDDSATAKYVAARNENANSYSSSQPGVTSTVGQYDDATAHYILRQAGAPETESIKTTSTQQEANMPMVLETTDVLFDFDKYVIKSSYIAELDQWANYFKNNPQATAVIYGHTDSVGTATYNQDLSLKRAQAVVDYLVRDGVASARLTASGFGESQPAASNKNAQGRQKNRRVELDF